MYYWSVGAYADLAEEHGKSEVADRICDLKDKRAGWLEDIHKALVEALGVRTCVGYVYRTGDKMLAFHLSIHHEKELTERHQAILAVVILHNHELVTVADVLRGPPYEPSRTGVLASEENRRRTREQEVGRQSRRRPRAR